MLAASLLQVKGEAPCWERTELWAERYWSISLWEVEPPESEPPGEPVAGGAAEEDGLDDSAEEDGLAEKDGLEEKDGLAEKDGLVVVEEGVLVGFSDDLEEDEDGLNEE